MASNDRANSIDYDEASSQRAEIALKCAPFTLSLFADMAERGIPLRAIAAPEGVKNQYLTRPVGLNPTENALLWLVQVGVLRREVDGQGITDSFRLTPTGYYLLGKWQPNGRFPAPTLSDRLRNFFTKLQPARFF